MTRVLFASQIGQTQKAIYEFQLCKVFSSKFDRIDTLMKLHGYNMELIF